MTCLPLSAAEEGRPPNRPQRPGPRAGRRGAFTLTELVVSIGVMVLMIAMAGTIFKVTTDSTGQATAIIGISDSLRLLEQTLRDDLGHVPRDGAILVIQSQPINAFWTQDAIDANPPGTDPMDRSAAPYVHLSDPEREVVDPDTGQRHMDLPRADILMTFTAQPGTSYLCPDITGELQQAVYGHAEIGELDATGAWVGGTAPDAFTGHDYPPQVGGTVFPQTSSAPNLPPTPAADWHLARRRVLLSQGSDVVDGSGDGALDKLDPTWADNQDDLPNTVDDTFDGADDVAGISSNGLLDGLFDVVDGSFNYEIQVRGIWSLAAPPGFNRNWYLRSRLDLAPPAKQAKRLGSYFIPRCASFKVEWALDLSGFVTFGQPGTVAAAPSELIWLDPGRGVAAGAPDPLGELVELAVRYENTGDTDGVKAGADLIALKTKLLNRFTVAPVGIDAQTPVWYANDEANPNGSSGDPDRYFPDALRITVDVFDPAGKLKRPIRHVMVIPVGG